MERHKRMILTVKLMPGAIPSEQMSPEKLLFRGSSCCRSSCHQRNCRSTVTCYWGNPRHGAIVVGVIAIRGTIVTPFGAFVVGAIIAGAIIEGAIIAGGIVAGAFIVP